MKRTQLNVTRCGMLLASSLFVPSSTIASQVGSYGPAFEETGFHGSGEYAVLAPDVAVNHFGGNLVVSSTDISVPSQGDFGLFVSRTHSSGGALSDATPHSALRKSDGPLGVGWTFHFGLLRYTPGGRPEFEEGNGARNIFYKHDHPSLAYIKPPLVDDQDLWITTDLSILVRVNPNAFVLYRPNGLRLELEREVSLPDPSGTTLVGHFVPTTVEDKSGNRWTIEYLSGWSTYYDGRHPIITKVTDEIGRTLEFRYTTSPSYQRLQYVDLNSNRLAEYTYMQVADVVYLRSHKTPEGRTTTYDYFTSSSKEGALRSITLSTGGQWEFDYENKRFFFQRPTGSGAGNYTDVLAVTSVNKGSALWSYSYPSLSSSEDNFTVVVNGPDGFEGNYTYYAYQADGGCESTEHWRIGRLLSSSEEFNGTQVSRGPQLYDAIPVSQEDTWEACGEDSGITGGDAAAVVAIREVVTQDGGTLVTDYSNYDLIFPGTITKTGAVVTTRTYEHLTNPSSGAYVLGLLEDEYTSVSTQMVNRSVRSYLGSTDGMPSRVTLYRNDSPSGALVMTFTYWDDDGKRGAMRSKSYGGYTENFDYQNGVLSSITRPSGTDMGPSVYMSRTVTDKGWITAETVNEVTRTIGYDDDGRMRSVTIPAGASTNIVYDDSNNKVTVTRASASETYTYDGWGRLASSASMIDGNTRTTSYQYDAFDKQKAEIRPEITYVMSYDVLGRLRNRNAYPWEEYDIEYALNSAGTTVTVTKNGTLTLAKTSDHYGRIISGNTNGNTVGYSYAAVAGGIRQTIAAGDDTRSITYDFIGNVVTEELPEYDGPITYEYDDAGRLWRTRQPEGDETRSYYDNGQLKSFTRNSEVVQFAYDGEFGNLKTASYGPVNTAYDSFDDQGRPTAFTLSVPIPARLNMPGTNIRTEALAAPVVTWAPAPCSEGEEADMLLSEVLGGESPTWTTCFAPSTISPAQDIILEWISVPGASGYEIELGDDGTAVARTDVVASQLEFHASGAGAPWDLNTGMRVRAIEGTKLGPWSPWRTVGDGIGSLPACVTTLGPSITSFSTAVTYNSLGEIGSVSHTSGPIQSYSYAQGAGVSAVLYDGASIVNNGGYNLQGKLETATYQSHDAFHGGVVTRAYDVLGRLTNINSQVLGFGSAGAAQFTVPEHDASWDAPMRLTRIDGLGSTDVAYTYSGVGQLKTMSITHDGPTGPEVSYVYDNRGNLKVRTAISTGPFSLSGLDFEYDGSNRIDGYTYDAAGRLTSDAKHRFSYNAINQIAEVKLLSGELLEEHWYDAEGKRVAIIAPDRITYLVRGLNGELLRRVKYGVGADGCWGVRERRDFVYFDGKVVAEVDAEVGTRRFITHDLFNNPAVVFDETEGFAPEYAYVSPYGENMIAGSSNIRLQHEFGTYERDSVSGLDYAASRFFSPHQGRFVVPDPQRDKEETNPAGYNLYSFVRNSPTALEDITGGEATKRGNTESKNLVASVLDHVTLRFEALQALAVLKREQLKNVVPSSKNLRAYSEILTLRKVAKYLGPVDIGLDVVNTWVDVQSGNYGDAFLGGVETGFDVAGVFSGHARLLAVMWVGGTSWGSAINQGVDYWVGGREGHLGQYFFESSEVGRREAAEAAARTAEGNYWRRYLQLRQEAKRVLGR